MASSAFSTIFSPITTLQPGRKPITRIGHLSISATISEKPSQANSSIPAPVILPKREIPGDYGLPGVGPIKDRQDFFYNQGRDEFFRSRIKKYSSTVFRANMPPGPFISSDPKVIILLDAKSFPVLFDVSKVEKRDLFTGTYMPSTELTGGYRVLSYLDPSEPSHAKLKKLLFFLLTYRREHVIPDFQVVFGSLFQSLENEVSAKGKSDFGPLNEQASFNFLAKAFYNANPADTKLGTEAPTIIGKWVLFHLGPIITLGLPKLVEEPLLHTFPLPPFLIKSDYQKLYDFIFGASKPVLEEAEKMGINKEEACHNLVFATCFNSFGGMKIFFPSVLKWIGLAGKEVHLRLAEEIRSAVKSNGGAVTMRAMEQMPLMKSVVYESFRIEPPVAYQYGKAKKDLVVESHDGVFQVKKGEMLFGFQPFATKDPKIFEKAEEFVPDRFVGEEGEKLLNYVFWSNGRETEQPTLDNKQCAGKDFVVLMSRLLVVEIFRRYDSFEIDVGSSPLGSTVTITSLKRASN